MITEYLKTNWVELFGVILSLIYLYLSIRQKISLWIFGFLSSAFYIVVFFQTKFYADMSLQFYYLIISVYGWINWKRGKNRSESELPVGKLSKKWLIRISIATVLTYISYYLILKYLTDSTIPASDSLVGALSVIATWMLAKKLIENWLVWIAADGLCIGLYVYKGLYLTSVLFLIYTVMAYVGYINWKKDLRNG